MTPPDQFAKTTFVILSWEGPDPYSNAGGLGVRVTGLSQALAAMGFETHLFFIGDPDRPGHEVTAPGELHLHRWCQWISRHHPAGVYDGEEGKLSDWTRSLAPWLETELLGPKVADGDSVVVLAEEWQTTGSAVALRDVVTRRGWQGQVHLFWNANNTYSFNRVDWAALSGAAHVTTVSRYMKHAMWPFGVDAHVIPNGIAESWLAPISRGAGRALSKLFRGRLALVKVARWHPDKRWNMAVDAVARLKGLGMRPLFLARGGMENHAHEVLARARLQGLEVGAAGFAGHGVDSLIAGVSPVADRDMVVLENPLSEEQRRALFRSCHAVLANSGVEPFGLVGLEAMAVGGIAFVGATGEDYVTPGYDAVALQTKDSREIVYHVAYLRSRAERAGRMRQAARRTALRYTWRAVIERALLPFLRERDVPVVETPRWGAAAGPDGGPRPPRSLLEERPRPRWENGPGTRRPHEAVGVVPTGTPIRHEARQL